MNLRYYGNITVEYCAHLPYVNIKFEHGTFIWNLLSTPNGV